MPIGGGGGAKFNGGTITAGETISPATDSPALTINVHPGSGQTTLPFRYYDETGALSVDIDSAGILDAKHIVVQDPPDTGGSPGSLSLQPATLTIARTTAGAALLVKDATNNAVIQAFATGHGDILEINPVAATDTAVVLVSPAAASVDALQYWDSSFSNILAKISASGGGTFTGIHDQSIVSGALPTVTCVSGTGRQVSTTRDVETVTPVTFNPGAATTATCTVALSPDNVTYSTLGIETEPAGVAFDGTIHLVKVRVPAGWYIKLTVNAQAVLGTTTYY